MTARARILLVAAGAAAVAVALTVGVTALSSEDEKSDVRSGHPPLALDLGVRTDREAVELRRAEGLYVDGEQEAAAQLFARFASPQARIGQAFAAWPDGSLARVEQLAGEYPRSAVVQYHLGLARFWAGRGEEAMTAWRAAVRANPDSASAVRANDLLHPDSPQGLPYFLPGFKAPKALGSLSPPQQLHRLARDARTNDFRAKLLYGLALQRLGRPLSAERQYVAAAALAPESADAQVAAAVGRYRKDDPARAFARLGPLTRQFPHAATVRFHLGLLLLWLGRVDDAKRQLELARRLQPRSLHAKESSRFLLRLKSVGTTGEEKSP